MLQRYLGGFQADKVLDVGPGYGNFGRVAAQATGAQRVVYVDCDPDVLTWQQTECRRAGLPSRSILLSLDNITALSGLEGCYDLILCQEVLEHLANADDVLRSLVAHLSAKGRIVITVPTQRSERWLKWLNASYMRNEMHGHVREFDEHTLTELLRRAGLSPLVFIPTQPHCFVSHTWLYGTRMKVEGSSGRVLTMGVRGFVYRLLGNWSCALFRRTGYFWWGRLLPRNYFVVAVRTVQGQGNS